MDNIQSLNQYYGYTMLTIHTEVLVQFGQVIYSNTTNQSDLQFKIVTRKTRE